MLQIHYVCCRNSLCEVLEKDDVWPEACLTLLNRFHIPPAPRRRKDGMGLSSLPVHGHPPGHLWLCFSGAVARSGWVFQGEGGPEEAPSLAVPAKDAGAVPQPRCRGVGPQRLASEGS